MIDHITLTSDDDGEIPARQVLRIHGHPTAELGEAPGISIEYCEASETPDTATFDITASFYVDAEELRRVLDLVLDRSSK